MKHYGFPLFFHYIVAVVYFIYLMSKIKDLAAYLLNYMPPIGPDSSALSYLSLHMLSRT